MSSAYNVCFLYLSDVKHIISLRIHAVSIVTLIDAFTAFNPIWTHHEHFSSPNPYIGSWDTRHAKSGLHVVSRDVNPSSILAFHYILLHTWLQGQHFLLVVHKVPREVFRDLRVILTIIHVNNTRIWDHDRKERNLEGRNVDWSGVDRARVSNGEENARDEGVM